MSVETSRHGHILVIRMARPEKRNALNADITAGIDAAMNQLEDDPDLWCGILTGGETVFSAGADLASGPGEPTPRGGIVGLIQRGDESLSWQRSNKAHTRLLQTEDVKEGIGAFFEKRAPSWTGR